MLDAASDYETHSLLMAKRQQQLMQLAELVPAGSPIVYLDYPTHFNAGDLLINLGAEKCFRALRYNVLNRKSIFELSANSWDPPQSSVSPMTFKFLDRLSANVIIVFHGGGNFGDIYPAYQRMRKQIIERYRDRRIVVLPQSLHYSDGRALEEDFRALARHPDLHIYLRDQHSWETCTAHGLRARLLPDMAHALWTAPELSDGIQISDRRLTLYRTDDEVHSERSRQQQSFDWPDLVRPQDTLVWRLLRRAMTLGVDPKSFVTWRAWYWERDRIVRRALAVYRQHSEVVTDRLHGLILAALLKRPVQYVDNSYGKLSRYVDTWLRESPLITPALKDEPTKARASA
jgi:pyruvyl transferase EpsO